MPRKPWIPARKRRTQVYRKPNETKHFTHYWKNSTWTDGSESEGEPLDHTASNLFGKRGVTKGDLVYVLTVKRGLLYLCARLEVDRVTSQEDAEQQFGEEVWPAKDHIIGQKDKSFSRRHVDAKVGVTLTFRKDDPFVHSIFSLSNKRASG